MGRLARELRDALDALDAFDKRGAARRQPIAATRNERVSSMLPRMPFGISSCNGNAAAFAGRSRFSRTTPYRQKCARRWERFSLASGGAPLTGTKAIHCRRRPGQ